MPDNKPEKKEDPKALDPRLMGGRWYFSSRLDEPKYSYGYYKFTSDSKFICSDKDDLNPYEVVVYSKNGIVYEKDTNTILLYYEFHDTFPYANTATHGFTSDMRWYADFLAAHNDLITCTASGIKSLYPNDIVDFFKFLVRFNEDGTPYGDYEE